MNGNGSNILYQTISNSISQDILSQIFDVIVTKPSASEFNFAVTLAGNVQSKNVCKVAQVSNFLHFKQLYTFKYIVTNSSTNCTGFIFCTFQAVVHL